MAIQISLLVDISEPAMLEDFRYRPDPISAQEETLLAAYSSGIPLKPFAFHDRVATTLIGTRSRSRISG